jgi:SNF2 helicase protein
VFVVHAAWLAAGRVAVWAEDSSAPLGPTPRPGRRPRRQPHPFAAPHEVLADVLVEHAAKAVTGTVVLALPTRGSGPVESPALIRDEVSPATGAVSAVGLWEVPTLKYDADGAFDTAGAHRFLRDAAPLLSTAGFGVLLPSWWTKPTSHLGLD